MLKVLLNSKHQSTNFKVTITKKNNWLTFCGHGIHWPLGHSGSSSLSFLGVFFLIKYMILHVKDNFCRINYLYDYHLLERH